MAFSFNDLSAKLSKAGQSLAQKANEVGDTAKLSLRSSELAKANQALYAKLGEAYFNAFGQAPAEELADTCGEIQKNMDEIAKIRAEIQRIKQVKVCPGCGAENPSDTAFCSSCGAPMPKDEAPAPAAAPAGKTCPGCGAPMKDDATFCTQCGTKLESSEQQ